VSTQSGGQEPAGFALVPEKVQVVHAEFLQQMLRAPFHQDQKSSYADYMQLSMQSQFNKRAL
jgi:hypothetical protein